MFWDESWSPKTHYCSLKLCTNDTTSISIIEKFYEYSTNTVCTVEEPDAYFVLFLL